MPLIGASKYYSGFSPTSIPDCALWLDAADTGSISLSASNVTQWNDKSGNGRNAVVSSNAFATLTGTPQGLLFNNSFYTTTLSADPAVETGFAVYNMTSNGMLVGAYNAGRQIAFQSLTLVGPLKAQVAWGPLATSAGNVRQMVTTFVSSTATSSAVNGGTAATGGGLTFTSGNVTTLGREAGNSFPYAGLVHEIILFNANLTTPQRQLVEGYLARKWGLTSNLPVTQPFRSLPPFSRPFIPVDISGCAVWLDGADSNAMTFSGANIVQWLDKSGNGRHGSNVGPGNPTLGTTTTGRRAVVMSGSNYFRLSNASTLSVTSASYFVQAFATGSNRTLLSFWNNERILGPTYYWNNATNTSLSPYAWSNTNAVLSVVENPASNTVVNFNGNALTGPSYRASTANSNVILGAHWSLDVQWLGNIQEVILYDIALTPGQRQQVETYLTNKWGTRGAVPSGHYARISPALGVSFAPTLIDRCALWLDAADAASVTLVSGTVSQWNDKSGNNRHATQTTSQFQPSWSNATMVMPGSSRYFNMTDAFGMVSATNRYHIFVVERRGSNAATHYMIGFGGGANTGIAFGYNDNTTFNFTSASVADTLYTVPGWQSSDPVRIWGGVYNGTTRELFLNGTRVTTTAYTTNLGSWATPTIGYLALAGINSTYIGNIYEILFYGSVLTVAERQIIEGYLANKWNLASSLPAGHPFRTFKP